MTTILIPKEKVLELIKKDTCNFYDYINYQTLEVNVVDTKTQIEVFECSGKLNLSFESLATLLFDRVEKVSEELLIIIS